MNFIDRHKTLATACLIFTLVFCYQMVGIWRTISDFDQLWAPPKMADVLMAFVFGLAAFATALGINVRSLLVSLGMIPAWDGVEKRGAEQRAAVAAVDQAVVTVATKTAAAITSAAEEGKP